MNANLHRREFLALTGVAAVAGPSLLARASEPDAKRTAIMEKAAAYLRSQQDAATGGWSIPAQGPAFPAITALVVSGMLGVPGVSESDPAVAKGIEYMLA